MTGDIRTAGRIAAPDWLPIGGRCLTVIVTGSNYLGGSNGEETQRIGTSGADSTPSVKREILREFVAITGHSRMADNGVVLRREIVCSRNSSARRLISTAPTMRLRTYANYLVQAFASTRVRILGNLSQRVRLCLSCAPIK